MNSIHERLRTARENAGYRSLSDAIKAFGWVYSTYAGHENGQRGIKDVDKEKYAKAFGVSIAWLQSGRDTPEKSAAPEFNQRSMHGGFSEPDVAPYHPQSDTLRRKMIEVARAMSTSSGQITFYEMQRSLPALMLISGDILLVDQKRTIANQGGIVISRLINEQTEDAHTVLRLQHGTEIIPAYGEAALGEDEVEAAIGTVICSIRPSLMSV